MLHKLNRQLEKIMPLITPVGVVTGVIFSVHLTDFSYLIPWIFAFMTFAGSLSSNFRSLKEVMAHPFPIFMAMLILHVLMPAWTWGVGHVAFSGDVYTITGLILGMVIHRSDEFYLGFYLQREYSFGFISYFNRYLAFPYYCSAFTFLIYRSKSGNGLLEHNERAPRDGCHSFPNRNVPESSNKGEN